MHGLKKRIKRKMILALLHLSPLFDEKWYREQAKIPPEVDAAAYYLDGGWRNSDPSLRFRQDRYLEANSDVREAMVCPLAHYLLDGRRQHRLLYPGMIENHYYRFAITRAAKRRWFELVHHRKIVRNRSARLLVIVHIYYEESAGEILEYLKNLRPYHYDLVVTVPEDRNTELIRRVVLQFREDAEIRIVPNRGFDIWPYLDALNDRDPNRYDLVFKLQSKRCFSRRGDLAEDTLFRGRDWFVALFRSVLGARWLHLNIDRLMRDERISLIAARNLFWTDTPRKKQITEKRLVPFGLSLPEEYSFVAGSCFVVRASMIQSARDLGVSSEDFGTPVRGAFTLAHALERCLTGRIPEEEKRGNSVCLFRQWINRRCLYWRQKEDCRIIAAMRAAEPSLLDPSVTETEPDKLLTIAFAVTETGPDAVAGDLFTAKELASALEKKGVRCLFVAQREPDAAWYRLNPEVDVLVSMLQHYDPQNIRNEAPGLLVVGWARNWFEAWAESPWINEYDLLLASSPSACAWLKERLRRPVHLFPIATNPDRFHPPEEDVPGLTPEETGGKYRCDYCFTGNHFGSPREIEKELDPEALPYRLNIYGKGWDQDERFAPWCRGHLSYEEMPAAYRSARIVLDDATPSTKELGAVNSRVYDAIAAGCLVLTNNEAGAEETFQGMLPAFNSRETLKEALELYLGNEDLRINKVKELRRFVLENHTYGIRAEQLLAVIRQSG